MKIQNLEILKNKQEMNGFVLAREVSKHSDYDRIHIGAVIIKKKRVLGIGFNQHKTHPKQKKLNYFNAARRKKECGFLHAEVNALNHVDNIESCKGATIFVYRETLNGDIGMSRPCPACMKAIKDAGIRTVIYTTPDGVARETLVISE